MMLPNQRPIDDAREVKDPALEAARSLARVIGESEIFCQFEAAQDAFMRDETARTRLQTYQTREQELRVAAMWGGAARDEQIALEREWQEVSALPTLQTYLAARNGVRDLFREITGRITEDIGVDYGAACLPAGGCC